MKTLTIATSLIGLTLAAGVRAQSPQYHYPAATAAFGTAAAVATTPGAGLANRSGYVLAATAGTTGALEVTAWQDTTKQLVPVGSFVADSNTIEAVAATGLDASHVVTADVDVNGVLSLRTWTVGGTSGLAQLNHANTPESTANRAATTQALALVELTATEVVTAYQDPAGDLMLQAWTIGDTGAKPVPLGAAANGGPVGQLAMAVIDSATLITAATTQSDDLAITTWGVDASGVHQQDEYIETNIVGGLYPSVSIGAATVETVNFGQFPQFQYSRHAFTPIINRSNLIEVLDWQISSTGVISPAGKPVTGGPKDFAFEVAACMLPTGVPMTVFGRSPGPAPAYDTNVEVGWFERSLDSEFTAVSGFLTGISSVAAANAGTDLNPLDPLAKVNAYFVTGALTSGGSLPPSITNPGTFKIQVWSYPIELPIT